MVGGVGRVCNRLQEGVLKQEKVGEQARTPPPSSEEDSIDS